MSTQTNMDVENEVMRVKQNILKLKQELLAEQLIGRETIAKIEKYKEMTMRISKEIENTNWKISKAELIQSYQEAKRRSYIEKIENSAIFKEIQKTSESFETSLEDSPELRKSLSNKLDQLVKESYEKEQKIFETQLRINKLKEENAAYIQKLLSELEEKENEERKLREILEELEAEEENIDFAVN